MISQIKTIHRQGAQPYLYIHVHISMATLIIKWLWHFGSCDYHHRALELCHATMVFTKQKDVRCASALSNRILLRPIFPELRPSELDS